VIDTLIVVVAVFDRIDDVRFGQAVWRQPVASAGAAVDRRSCARPLLSNLIAALDCDHPADPDRGRGHYRDEWGWIEDIASTYVVIRLWDWRRLVVPLSIYRRPFQNWTRTQS